MAVEISRTRVVFNVNNSVASNNFDIFQAPIIPNGETWQITRVLFADFNTGDNRSGGFLVDYGSSDPREIIAQAYLTGNTIDLSLQTLVVGDGIKRLRIIRENNSSQSKKLVAMVVAFNMATG